MKSVKMFSCVSAIIFFCLFFISCTQSSNTNTEIFCENSLGIDFNTSRDITEKEMTRVYGNKQLKEKEFTLWQNANGEMAYACFFKDDKLVGVSVMYTISETPDNINKVKEIYISSIQDLDSDGTAWVFEKNIYNEIKNKDTKIIGALYACAQNPREKMLLTIARKPSSKFISIDMIHYLYGVGMREF